MTTEEQNDRLDVAAAGLDDRFIAHVLGLGDDADFEAIVVRFDSLSQERAERVLLALESEVRRIRGLL